MEGVTETDYERLGELVEDNHHGALPEPDTCDVDAACAAGLYLLAAHMLASAADVSPELDSELARLYDDDRMAREQAAFALMPRYRCPRCGATVNCWDEDHTHCHGCEREPEDLLVARAFHEAALRADPSGEEGERQACPCGLPTRRLASSKCQALMDAEDDEEECLS